MDRRFPEEEIMTRKRRTKFIHEGQYAAEVDVELLESQEGWAPYLSLEDARKLDEVRAALRRGDLQRASQMARVFKLTPVAG
jgi:hypothetical protein